MTICEVGGKERIVEIPVTPSTSFDDVKKSVSNGAGGHFFEKWRRHGIGFVHGACIFEGNLTHSISTEPHIDNRVVMSRPLTAFGRCHLPVLVRSNLFHDGQELG